MAKTSAGLLGFIIFTFLALSVGCGKICTSIEPENSIIKQYQKLFDIDGIELKFTKDAISEIAKIAYDRQVGARGLRGIIEKIMNDIMFEAPDIDDLSEIIIDKSVITHNRRPRMIKRKKLIAG